MRLCDKSGTAISVDLTNMGYKYAAAADNLEIIDQRGQTCGLYALAAILRAKGVAVKATNGDTYNYDPTTGKNYLAGKDSNADPSLRSIAKKTNRNTSGNKITQVGELFVAADIPTLVRAALAAASSTVSLSVHYAEITSVTSITPNTVTNAGVIVSASTTTSKGFSDSVKDAIDANKLVMVPFSLDDSGYPGTSAKGEDAHWCVVFGYGTASGDTVFLAGHLGTVYGFKATDLAASNAVIGDFPESYWYKKQSVLGVKDNIDYDKCKVGSLCYCKKSGTDCFNGTVDCYCIPKSELSTTLAKKFVIIG